MMMMMMMMRERAKTVRNEGREEERGVFLAGAHQMKRMGGQLKRKTL